MASPIDKDTFKKLLRNSIDHYERFKTMAVVKGAAEQQTDLMIPIPYFGCVNAYEGSQIRIITVGLNPSNREFQKSKSEKSWRPRFQLSTFPIEHDYLRDQLNKYFETNPYMGWFNNFEQVLNGAGASYFKNKQKNVALHLDLCSPLATDPTWSKLGEQNRDKTRHPETLERERNEKNKLTYEGTALFNLALEALIPDIVIFGVGQVHLKSHFDFLNRDKLMPCEPHLNDNPKKNFTITFNNIKGKNTLFANGSANVKPFGNFTKEQKSRCGKKITEFYSDNK
jgi:hypothetical protein